MQKLRRLEDGVRVTSRAYNTLVDAINQRLNFKGVGGITVETTPMGTVIKKRINSIAAPIKWFRLTTVDSNPMTGREQKCIDGWFGDKNEIDVSIYRYPQFTNQTSYQVSDIIAAQYVGNSWISFYNTPHEIKEYS